MHTQIHIDRRSLARSLARERERGETMLENPPEDCRSNTEDGGGSACRRIRKRRKNYTKYTISDSI